jgi:hypothetical protein
MSDLDALRIHATRRRSYARRVARRWSVFRLGRWALPWVCVFLTACGVVEVLQVAAASPPPVQLRPEHDARHWCDGDGISPDGLPTETRRAKELNRTRCQAAGLPDTDPPVLANG